MISCSDITYLEYVKIITRQYDSVPLLANLSVEQQDSVRTSIAAEFQELVGDLSFKNYSSMVEQFKKLDLKRLTCLSILNMLEVFSMFDEAVIAMLSLLKITVTADSVKSNIITKVTAILKKSELKMKSLEVELNKILESAKHNDVTEADLIKVVASISVGLMFSVSVNDNAIVIAGYINILNKQQEKQNGKEK